MKVGMIFRVAKPIPFEIVKEISGVANIDNETVSYYDIEDFEESIFIRENSKCKIKIENGPIFYSEINKKEIGKHLSVCGYVVFPDVAQAIVNPKSDFVDYWSPICGGVLRQNATIACEYVPKKVIERIGDMNIYRKDFVNFLDQNGAGKVGGLVCFDGNLVGYNTYRFSFRQQVVLPEIVLKKCQCPICLNEEIRSIGVWIGKDEVLNNIAEEDVGYGHKSLSKPIVVSCSFAFEVNRITKFRGIVFEPIFHYSSNLGKKIISICKFFKNYNLVF